MAPIKEWYGAYNVIFNWFEKNFGKEGLVKYWQHIGRTCCAEVIETFKGEGLAGVKKYFEGEFSKEGAEITASLEGEKLFIDIKKCPAYEFMNESDNPYFTPRRDYCGHDEAVNTILARE